MSELLLQGGRVIDKSGERLADVLVDSEGRIAEVGKGLKGRETLDVRGKVISSGFVDLNAYIGGPEDQLETTAIKPEAAKTAIFAPSLKPVLKFL